MLTKRKRLLTQSQKLVHHQPEIANGYFEPTGESMWEKENNKWVRKKNWTLLLAQILRQTSHTIDFNKTKVITKLGQGREAREIRKRLKNQNRRDHSQHLPATWNLVLNRTKTMKTLQIQTSGNVELLNTSGREIETFVHFRPQPESLGQSKKSE